MISLRTLARHLPPGMLRPARRLRRLLRQVRGHRRAGLEPAGRPPRAVAGLPAVVATDLDGTVLRSDGTVSARTAAVLAAVEAAGTLVVLVTGRPPRWLRPVARELGHHGVAICANGALVFDLHTETVVGERLIDPTTAAVLVDRLRAGLPRAVFAAEYSTGFAHEPNYPSRWERGRDHGGVAPADALVARPVAKLLVRHPRLDADALLARALELVGGLATFTHSSREGLLEVSALGVTKASTLEQLCAARGLGPADVLAFGDMPNDLHMLTWAGRGVAVANAHPSVLAAVSEVTASNDEDGVAEILERLLLAATAGGVGRAAGAG